MTTIPTAAVLTTALTLGLGLAATTATATSTPAGSSTSSGLAFSREEERMAQDLYAALATTYDQARPMSMITRSETQHFDAIGALLSTYDIADPSAGRPPGSYAFPELQALYDEWLAKGRTGLNAAYEVGVALEQRDIADLKKAITATSEPDVVATYQRLLSASERHQAAFERALAGGMPTGSGRGAMAGQGAGNGQGHGRGMNGMPAQRGTGVGQQNRSGSCPLQN